MRELIEFLAHESARIYLGGRWMCVTRDVSQIDSDISQIRYTVYSRPYGAKKTKILYNQYNLHIALDILKGEQNEPIP